MATSSSTAYSASLPSAADMSSPATTNGEQNGMAADGKANSTTLEGSSAESTHHAISVASYIFEAGYLGQDWADIQIVFFGTSLRLHRLILSRSPYFAHIMRPAPLGSSLDLRFTDKNITHDSVHICIHHLYQPALHLVTPTNARAILATSYLFQGMPELVHHAYTVCRDTMSPENVIDHVQWLGSSAPQANGHQDSSSTFAAVKPNGGDTSMSPSQTGDVWTQDATLPYGEWSARLKQDLLDFIIQSYPQSLLDSGSSPTSDPTLLSIYVCLPFEVFQLALESPQFPVDNIQQRFAFAKKAVAQRKKTQASAHMDEAVVLAMNGGAGMEVHITRKPKKSRAALWKVEG